MTEGRQERLVKHRLDKKYELISMKELVFNKPKLLGKHLKVILGQWMIICEWWQDKKNPSAYKVGLFQII